MLSTGKYIVQGQTAAIGEAGIQIQVWLSFQLPKPVYKPPLTHLAHVPQASVAC